MFPNEDKNLISLERLLRSHFSLYLKEMKAVVPYL